MHVVEGGRRLSESILWQLQRERYDLQGIEAWSHGNVPQSITTSPYIARAYARIVLGYLRDRRDQLDPNAPLYVVELGAGSGRFGYRFIKHFSKTTDIDFTYVMTDVAPNLVDFWRSHPRLRPLVETGKLDFALFDATNPADITLINTAATLRTTNPVIVIANYFFDSIPHDCFSVHDHQLYENLVHVTSDQNRPPLEMQLTDLKVNFEGQPAKREYYFDQAINDVLEVYRQQFDGQTFFLPVAGMVCIRHFQGLSNDRALFLIGDIGASRASDVAAHAAGGIGSDSNFWLEVNFHALGEFVARLGGITFHPPQRHASLNISGFVLGASTAQLGQTGLAYDDAIGHLGPDDYFVLSRLIANNLESMTRGELLAFLRSGGWDSEYFQQCMPYLLDSLQEPGWSGREDVRRAVEEAWDVFYPIGDTADAADLPSSFGVLLYTIGDYAQALDYFLRSLEFVSVDPKTTFNVALCLFRLERLDEALDWTERTLALDPSSEQAQAMRASLLSVQPSP